MDIDFVNVRLRARFANKLTGYLLSGFVENEALYIVATAVVRVVEQSGIDTTPDNIAFVHSLLVTILGETDAGRLGSSGYKYNGVERRGEEFLALLCGYEIKSLSQQIREVAATPRVLNATTSAETTAMLITARALEKAGV